MTREEAIKSLQNIVEYWTYKPTEVEAAKMLLPPSAPSAGSRWRRSGGVCGNTICRLWELEIYSAAVQNAGEPLM